MKKSRLYLLIPFIYFFASCGNHKQGSENAVLDEAAKLAKTQDTLKSIISSNINKKPAIDTVFLGFAFGMSKQQAMNHFNSLIKEKKLVYNDAEPHYRYPLAFSMIKANAAIAPQFQDGKLYKLTLLIEGDDDNATAQTVYLQAAEAYMKKYSSYSLFQEPDVVDENLKQFHWIKNNLHIFLHENVEGTMVSYSNMLIEEKLDQKKSENNDTSQAKTNKDI